MVWRFGNALEFHGEHLNTNVYWQLVYIKFRLYNEMPIRYSKLNTLYIKTFVDYFQWHLNLMMLHIQAPLGPTSSSLANQTDVIWPKILSMRTLDAEEREYGLIRHQVSNKIGAQEAGEMDLVGIISGLPLPLPR